jgi:flagella basal body P-ring formation protein FlgA
MIALAYLAMAACLAVDPASDQITARDVTPAFPELAAIDPATRLAFAPGPGATRVFRMPELRQIAARFQLPASPDHEICMQRPAAPLDPAALLASMRNALPGARIEIVDYSHQPAPMGAIEFSRESLVPEVAGRSAAIWHGVVRYAGTRRFAIWARVKVTITEERVVATADLRTGRPIEPGQILLQMREEFPTAGSFAGKIEDVAGKWPRTPIRAGTEIRVDTLGTAKEVAHGDAVRVDVSAGATHLEFQGVAETSGAVGEFISVRNPDSNKRFRARVEARGRVSVGSHGSENPL